MKCDYCEKGYAVRDIGRDTRAWIEGEEFVIQEFDKKRDRFFERRFKMAYCPYCGKMIKRNKWHYEDGMPEES